MKRVGAAVLLPFLLLALEKVNLIKNSSFERDDETWHAWTRSDEWPSVSIASKHDHKKAYTGSYSGSGDTRIDPGKTTFNYLDMVFLTQRFDVDKNLEDIDSVILSYCIFPLEGDIEKSASTMIALHFDRDGINWMRIGYGLKAPDLNLNTTQTLKFMEEIDFFEDTLWYVFSRNIGGDIREKYVPPLAQDEKVDSFILWVTGVYRNIWRGQKVFFDDVRLMGYADFDVGVKEITSAEVASPGLPYTPEARIKNFGREDADEFSIILTIEDSTGIIRIDTVPYTLPADTEDTLSFDPVTFPVPGVYNLRIRTEMVPDESDEDDEKSLQISVTGVEEPLKPIVTPFCLYQPFPNPFTNMTTVRFSVPYATHVDLKVYDVSGRMVTNLVSDKVEPGVHELSWNAKDDLSRKCAAGVYFVRFATDEYQASKKMVLVK